MAFLWYLTSLNWTPAVRKYHRTDYIKTTQQNAPTVASRVRFELELDDNDIKSLAPELYAYKKTGRAAGFAPGSVKRVVIEIRRKHRGTQHIQCIPLPVTNGRVLQALLSHRGSDLTRGLYV